MEQELTLGELKNKALSFDRAEMRDVHIVKDQDDYLSKMHMGVWNVDRNELASLSSKNYCVIQHGYVTESIIDALSSLNIQATAKLKTSRHGIHVDFDFPESKFELSEVGESFTSGMRVVNDYSKTGGLYIAPRVTRLACSNGMVVTEVVQARHVKYTEELQITLEGMIDKLIKDIIAGDEKLANMVSVCMGDSVEWMTLKLLLKQMFKKKKHIRSILNRLDCNKEKLSRWDVYNAVTNYATHGERLRPHVETFLQNKAAEIMKKSFSQLAEIDKPKEGDLEVSSDE